MLTRILLPVLLLFCLGVKAQTDLYYSQVVKPENKQEEALIAKFDTATFRFYESFIKDTSKTKFYPFVYFLNHFWGVDDIKSQYNWPMRKVLTPNHEIYGLWNFAFDTLSIYTFTNLFLHDTTISRPYRTGEYIQNFTPYWELVDGNKFSNITMLLHDYQRIIPVADYNKIIEKIKKSISYNNAFTKCDSSYFSMISFPLDTVILPQVDLSEFDYIIRGGPRYLSNFDDMAYFDNTLNQVIRRDKVDSVRKYTFIAQIVNGNFLDVKPTKKDSANLIAFWDSTYKSLGLKDTIITGHASPQCINVTYKWHYINTINKKEYERIPALLLVRELYSIGIEYENGGQLFYDCNYVKGLLSEKGIPFTALEQCFEAVLFKSLNISPKRTLRVKK